MKTPTPEYEWINESIYGASFICKFSYKGSEITLSKIDSESSGIWIKDQETYTKAEIGYGTRTEGDANKTLLTVLHELGHLETDKLLAKYGIRYRQWDSKREIYEEALAWYYAIKVLESQGIILTKEDLEYCAWCLNTYLDYWSLGKVEVESI